MPQNDRVIVDMAENTLRREAGETFRTNMNEAFFNYYYNPAPTEVTENRANETPPSVTINTYGSPEIDAFARGNVWNGGAFSYKKPTTKELYIRTVDCEKGGVEFYKVTDKKTCKLKMISLNRKGNFAGKVMLKFVPEEEIDKIAGNTAFAAKIAENFLAYQVRQGVEI